MTTEDKKTDHDELRAALGIIFGSSSENAGRAEEEKEMRHQVLNGVAQEFVNLFEGLETVDLQRGRNTATLFVKLVDILTRMKFDGVAFKELKTDVYPVIYDEKLFVEQTVTFKFLAEDGNFDIQGVLRRLETHDHPAISEELLALNTFDRALESMIDHAIALLPGTWKKNT